MHTPLASVLAADGSSSSGSPVFLIIVIALGAMLWFGSRGQRRQRQQVLQLQAELAAGQEVITSAGIYGIIVEPLEDRVLLQVADDVVIAVARQAIVRVVEPPEPEPSNAPSDTPEASDAP